MEIGERIHYYRKLRGLTQEEVSKNVGKSRPYVANAVRLQKLPDPVKKMLMENKLSAGHGRALLSIEDPAHLLVLANKAVEDQLSVRQTEELVKNLALLGKDKKECRKDRHSDFDSIETDITESIGAKVKIKEKNNKGTIQLSFYSRDELERLIELLLSLK